MDKSELEALLARIDIWLLVFGIVVVVGVAGESFFGIRHWWNSRKLQTLQNTESEAQRAEIANALGQAAAANERASKLELEAAQQRERAAKAEQDLLGLQRRIAPRHVSPAQVTKLSNDLKPLAGRKVAVFINPGMPENETFGNELAAALKRSGLDVASQLGMKFGGSPLPGISIMVGKNRLADAEILAGALANAGLAPKPVPAEKADEDESLRIFVAPR